MDILNTYIYEVKKGSKPLALMTFEKSKLKAALDKLCANKLQYFVQFIGQNKVNLFFGQKNALDVASMIFQKSLTNLSPCEDFILGVLLGYSIDEQCVRYKKSVRKHDKRVMKNNFA